MGNATSSVAEIKKKGDAYNEAVRRERALAGLPAGLAHKMSSKRFKKKDPSADQWKVSKGGLAARAHPTLRGGNLFLPFCDFSLPAHLKYRQ